MCRVPQKCPGNRSVSFGLLFSEVELWRRRTAKENPGCRRWEDDEADERGLLPEIPIQRDRRQSAPPRTCPLLSGPAPGPAPGRGSGSRRRRCLCEFARCKELLALPWLLLLLQSDGKRAMGRVHGGMRCVKFLLFIFNFIFWVSAGRPAGGAEGTGAGLRR